jgi:UDPglucose 6-dehydrogenase
VQAYDPTTCGDLSPHQQVALAGIDLVDDELAVADGADVVVVLTEWPDFAKIDLAGLAARAGSGTVVVDTRNLLDPALVREAGLGYEGVGRR